jgi:hypothetical protein
MQIYLDAHRTRDGYLAILRTSRGQEVGRAYCSMRDAAAHYAESNGAQVGLSFRDLARKVSRLASKLAKSKALRLALMGASLLPPPIGSVAMGATAALTVIAAVNKGSKKAAKVWQENAEKARENPNGPAAVAMRLAMVAIGRPKAPDEGETAEAA